MGIPSGGHFKLLTTAASYDSLGNYHAYITAIYGYKAKRHQGKITGLAARVARAVREIPGWSRNPEPQSRQGVTRCPGVSA